MRKITIYNVPDPLHAAIVALAKRFRRSMNSQLLVVLEAVTADQGAQQAPTEEAHDAE